MSVPPVDLAGRTLIITGASQGLGLESAVMLGRMGARLVLVVRNRARGEAALEQIRARSGAKEAELVVADLSVLAEVRRAADELLARCPRVDVLMNNAGSLLETRAVTADGFEATFATNHLSYFYLTHLLRERLVVSAPARVVNVASGAHRRARVDWGDLQFHKSWSSLRAYANTKLYNIWFTRELARRLEGTGVTANSLHPGAVTTGLWSNYTGVRAILVRVARAFMRSQEKGAETQVFLASSPSVARVSGKYFADCKESEPSALARDDAAARRLWDITEGLVGIKG